tara:strand:- start:2504 stop:3151 length:648 start_codon:yes stop_codon:yes gene_type:complete
MTLATSGALSLNQIHVEAGGSSGATCSLNDTDIRGLAPGSGKTINSTQGTAIDFDDFYGAQIADLTASGTSNTKLYTEGAGKSATTYTYKGISTTFASSATGSWSDQDYTTATRGSFKIYDCFTSNVGSIVQIVVDSSAGQGITWVAFSGFRYIKDGSGNVIFDSQMVTSTAQGQQSNFGQQGGGASSGTNGTTWSHNVVNQMPGSGSVSLVLSN